MRGASRSEGNSGYSKPRTNWQPEEDYVNAMKHNLVHYHDPHLVRSGLISQYEASRLAQPDQVTLRRQLQPLALRPLLEDGQSSNKN